MRAFPLVLILGVLLGASPAWAVKAFPSAEGFGAAETKGGRGGRVMEITNLNDSGPGSFRACAEDTGPRLCVFRVGGVIRLNSSINITERNSFVTIAGQTAPGAGVTLTPWPLIIAYGAHDVILRHVRHRQGYDNPPADGNNTCGGIIVYGPGQRRTHHIIIDHASVAWACDDSTQASGYVTDITFQWSIIGAGYEAAKGDPFGGSKGFIVGGNQEEAAQNTVSFHHNMLLQSGNRNPGGGPLGVLDWRYNLVYNWWVFSGNLRLGGTDNNIPTDKPAHHNFVGNKYVAGPETNLDGWLGELRSEAQTQVYVQDNETPWCGNTACPPDTFNLGWGNGTTQDFPASESQFRAREPFPAPPIMPTPRAALEAVLSKAAGATVPLRDALDTRLVSELAARGGNIGRKGAPFPTLPTATAALAAKDTDNDGMPDAWEDAHRLNPSDASDGPQVASNGYTNVENYLNELAGDDIELTPIADKPPSDKPIYLSAGGHGDTPSDSGDCTVPENILNPRKTLASALACMQVPGKVLYIRGGTYAGVINTSGGAIRGGSAPDAPTRIEGYQAEVVTLQLPVGGVNALEISGMSNFTVDKLIVDAMARADSNALACLSSTNIKIRNSHFRNSYYEVAYFNNCSTVEVTKTQFHDAAKAAVISLVVRNTSVTFDEVEIYNGPLQGIQAPTSAINNSLTISRSQIRNTGTGAGGPALDLGGGSGAVVVNNILDHNNAGIRIRATARGAQISHNAVASNTGVGIQCDSGAASVTISNNIAFSNGTDSVVNNCSGP